MDLETQTSSNIEEVSSSESNIEFVDTAQPATEAPAPKAAPAQSKMAALKSKIAESSAPVASASAPAAPAAPAWTPDLKFKVMDAEHEIEEFFKPLIKDEESLKKIKRLHEQALGIPHLEQSRDEFKTKYLSAQPRIDEYARVEQRLDKLSHFVQKKDFGSFFDEIKVPKKEIFAWVKKEIELMDAPPEARAQYEQAQQANSRLYELEQENQRLKKSTMEVEQQRAIYTIDQTIAQAAGAEAQFYNERMGNPNAFRDYVIAKGQQIQMMSGQKPQLSHVLDSVKQEFQKLGVIPQAQAPAQQAAAPAMAPGIVPATSKPGIPIVKAGGGSPVVTPVKSLKDLKERAAAL